MNINKVDCLLVCSCSVYEDPGVHTFVERCEGIGPAASDERGTYRLRDLNHKGDAKFIS